MSSTELIPTVNNTIRHHSKVFSPEKEETIVMVHGMFGNLSQFYLTLSPFLSKYFRVIMYDLRCHGKSEKTEGGFDLKTLAHDLDQVLEIHDVGKAHILGFSFGALIALKYASEFDHKVSSVIAIEVPPRHDYELKPKGTYTFDDFMAFVQYLEPDVRKNFIKSQRQLQKQYSTYEYIFNETNYAQEIDSEKEFDAEFFESIGARVLLLFGEHSVCIPELDRIRPFIEKATVNIQSGDHGFFMKNPEPSAQKIIQFIQKS